MNAEAGIEEARPVETTAEEARSPPSVDADEQGGAPDAGGGAGTEAADSRQGATPPLDELPGLPADPAVQVKPDPVEAAPLAQPNAVVERAAGRVPPIRVPRQQSTQEQAMLPSEVLAFLLDESFKPGPRPATFDESKGQVRCPRFRMCGRCCLSRVWSLLTFDRRAARRSGSSKRRRRIERSAHRTRSDGGIAAARRGAGIFQLAAILRSGGAMGAFASLMPPRQPTATTSTRYCTSIQRLAWLLRIARRSCFTSSLRGARLLAMREEGKLGLRRFRRERPSR
jgi:hypothetical protein